MAQRVTRIWAQQHVGRLDVAVQHAQAVQVRQACGELRREAPALHERRQLGGELGLDTQPKRVKE